MWLVQTTSKNSEGIKEDKVYGPFHSYHKAQVWRHLWTQNNEGKAKAVELLDPDDEEGNW